MKHHLLRANGKAKDKQLQVLQKSHPGLNILVCTLNSVPMPPASPEVWIGYLVCLCIRTLMEPHNAPERRLRAPDTGLSHRL